MLWIPIMRHRNIGVPDLNLLRALDVLLEERSTTRAADRLGLTQSAVSRLLGRLRASLGDPLFVRTSRGLEPTERAIALGGPLRQTMMELERVLLERPGFDPRQARRRFRIAAVDYAQVVILAPVLAEIATVAPALDFELRQPSTQSRRDLESGALDLLLMPQEPSGPGIVWTALHDEGYTCLVWSKHSCRRLTPARFAALPHVFVAPGERPGGVVDAVLAKQQLARRVAVQVPSFLVVPHLLIGTERIATVPTRMALALVRAHPLRILAPPADIPRFTICQAWHELHRHDSAHRWLRDTILRAARTAPRSRPIS
jgi:DNA-binding transcriptional LysR family regulator